MLLSYGLTDVGRRRTINEDSIFVADGLFVVCDGMGGHQAGEVASNLAVETIARFVQRSDADPELTWPFGFNPRLSFNANRLRTAIKLANRVVYRKGNSREEYTGMGTTAVAALVSAGKPMMTHAGVGDSRVYLLRGGGMVQLTRDDSLANVSWPGLDDDATAGVPPSVKHVLTKALGAREDVEFDVVDQAMAPGDVIVLCSDGLTNMLPDDRIRDIVAGHSSDLEAACRELVGKANAEGGRDNISVILVKNAG
jgi:protein phosphatase